MEVQVARGWTRSASLGIPGNSIDYHSKIMSNSFPKPRPLTEKDFEVIGLDDGLVRPPPGAAHRSASQPRRALTTTNVANRQGLTTSSIAPSRDLLSTTKSVRPTLPPIQSSPAGLSNSLQLPTKTSRRKKESRSPTRLRDPSVRHSSPSPPSPRSKSLNLTSSPLENASNSTTPSNNNRYKRPARRQSWQPGRKTIQEMEKECDDDDDDIPEDTVFWNIPLSPRAGKILPSASTSPSPERLSPVSRRNSGVSASLGLNGRMESPVASQSTVSLPSLSQSEGSENRGRLKSRGKSWGDVMHELGNDAKDLTEALERYADESIEAQEKQLQQKVAEARPSTSPPKIERIALPPKQLSESHMDPMPMSKEKEAALSRTRPAWLPPKPKEEELKHLKEYQEMMRLSIESDRRKAEKEKLEAANREKQKELIFKEWEETVIPNWNEAVLKPRTRELWWGGVSPKSRGVVWKRAFGNALSITEDTYKIALERAKSLEKEVNETEERSPEKDWFKAIRRDVESTLPESKLFQPGAPLNESLIDVLMAYSLYRKDIGYIFGLHGIAAHLLLNLSAFDAFTTLANLLNRNLPLTFFLQDEASMTQVYAMFLKAFQYKLPSLYKHIHVKLQLPPPLYLECIFTTLFTLHAPIDIVARLIDVYAFEGDPFIIRTAVAVLTTLEGRLYGGKEDVMSILGWESVVDKNGKSKAPERDWRLGHEDDFLVRVRSAGKVES